MEVNAAFKVWWIPQVSMKAFEVPVKTVQEGRKLCHILAEYDMFQYVNNIKPDYANMGGVVYRHNVTDWEWHDVPDDDDEWAQLVKEMQEQEARVG